MQIRVDGVHKSFGSLAVLINCSLGVGEGEIVTLLGPSGCGKTTLLRCIAGFHMPEAGRIHIADRDVTFAAPNRRKVGMVFQSYALFPHMTVARNVAFGLKVAGVPKAGIEARVAATLDLVSLTPFAGRYPGQLSGGQQQRVALARVLILEPMVLLLDEPFNALDAKLRYAMQVELKKLIKKLGITAIFVTHDQAEALTISDRIAVMRGGLIDQIDAPLALYDRPVNAHVADFIGSANLLTRTAAEGRIEIMPGISLPTEETGEVVVVIRPESLAVDPAAAAESTGLVSFVNPVGPVVEYEIQVGGEQPFKVMAMRRPGESGHAVGSPVRVRLKEDGGCVVLAEGRRP